MKTSEKIRILRQQKGMTQEDLGKACGLQRAAINKYEKGRVVNIKKSVLCALADALDVAPVDLLDDEDTFIIDTEYTALRSADARAEQNRRLLYYFSLLDSANAELLITIARSLAERKDAND